MRVNSGGGESVMRAAGVSVALAPCARGKQKTATVVAVFVVSGRQIACVPPLGGISGEDLTEEFFNFFVFLADVFLEVALPSPCQISALVFASVKSMPSRARRRERQVAHGPRRSAGAKPRCARGRACLKNLARIKPALGDRLVATQSRGATHGTSVANPRPYRFRDEALA